MFKKGDTLIEVMLAVGIFSMVAVAVVAVMSNGTAGAQTALETTLTREEIDAQAEALRFIQSSYIADKDTGDDRFAKLWQAITKNANSLNDANEEKIVQYSPSSCSDLYTKTAETFDDIFDQNAFVINTHWLGDFTSAATTVNDDTLGKVVISANSKGDKFAAASTYPRLVFGNSTDNTDNDSLLETNSNSNLFRAEGIYIVAVKDRDTTHIVSENSPSGAKQPAFYDFYIRTCWYGLGDQTPSTISTVIRLYDPSVITTPSTNP
ncbi:MAG: hypothetical protein Q4A70_03285 [Candidatus Saccharibacteria bacterium]|nr:hypothetical protein [Candidatus Saccharibacteria bacterium]